MSRVTAIVVVIVVLMLETVGVNVVIGSLVR